MWPGGQRSDARTCGARLMTVGTRAPPLPDVRAARAVSVSVHGLYERMRARAVSVCMMGTSTCQAQDRAVFSIHGANVAEALATAGEPDMANSQLPQIFWRAARLAKQLFSRAPFTAKAVGNRSSARTTQTRCCGDAVVQWASLPDLPAKYGNSRLHFLNFSARVVEISQRRAEVGRKGGPSRVDDHPRAHPSACFWSRAHPLAAVALFASAPVVVAAPLAAPLITAVRASPRRRTRCRSSSRRRQLLLSSKLLLSSPRRSSRRRHSSRCHHSSLAAFLSSTLFLSSPPTVPRTPFVSFPLRLPLLSSTPHLLDAAPSSHTPAPPPAPLAPQGSAARAAYVHMLLCIGLTVTVWYALEHAMYKRFAVRELMARVCSRMFLCLQP